MREFYSRCFIWTLYVTMSVYLSTIFCVLFLWNDRLEFASKPSVAAPNPNARSDRWLILTLEYGNGEIRITKFVFVLYICIRCLFAHCCSTGNAFLFKHSVSIFSWVLLRMNSSMLLFVKSKTYVFIALLLTLISLCFALTANGHNGYSYYDFLLGNINIGLWKICTKSLGCHDIREFSFEKIMKRPPALISGVMTFNQPTTLFKSISTDHMVMLSVAKAKYILAFCQNLTIFPISRDHP